MPCHRAGRALPPVIVIGTFKGLKTHASTYMEDFWRSGASRRSGRDWTSGVQLEVSRTLRSPHASLGRLSGAFCASCNVGWPVRSGSAPELRAAFATLATRQLRVRRPALGPPDSGDRPWPSPRRTSGCPGPKARPAPRYSTWRLTRPWMSSLASSTAGTRSSRCAQRRHAAISALDRSIAPGVGPGPPTRAHRLPPTASPLPFSRARRAGCPLGRRLPWSAGVPKPCGGQRRLPHDWLGGGRAWAGRRRPARARAARRAVSDARHAAQVQLLLQPAGQQGERLPA